MTDPAALNDRLSALSPEQRALFETLREKQRKAAARLQPPPVRRVTGPTAEGDWPLSFDQERFWFVEQLFPAGAGLTITAATRMHGPVSVPAVGLALDAIVRRHAAWRTSFPTVDGRPVQRVAAPRPQPLALIDLTSLADERREAEALRLVKEEAAAPFDLEWGPLVRSALVRVGPADHVCILAIHHLVTDWISFQIAFAELAALLASDGPPALPEPPVQYPDFAVWQREWLQGEVLDDLVSWWREQLSGFPLALEVPTDRPRPAVMRMRGGRLPLRASRELAAALHGLARLKGATLFMTVLAATAALLHRASGQEKLILGANNANRNRPELEPVLGCFLTQVPFPVDLSGDPAFRELLARVRQSALAAFAHQDLPFGKLVEALQPARDTSRPPIVQTLVQVLDGQYSEAGLAGATFEVVDAWDGVARYDLMLTLFDYGEDGLVGSLEYDADLFDATTAARLAELLFLQMERAAAEPEVPLSSLPALSEAARHQALVEWNDSARPLPDWTVPERFAARVTENPDAVAVLAGGESLTYGELERRSDALAHRLRAAGIGPESRVALFLDRGVDMPVAILGVWKAGGAYVPLDPEWPAERLALVLEDAEPAVLVHRGSLPMDLFDEATAACGPHPRPLSQPHTRTPGRGESGDEQLPLHPSPPLGRRDAGAPREGAPDEAPGEQERRHMGGQPSVSMPPSPGGPGVRPGEGSGVRALARIDLSDPIAPVDSQSLPPPDPHRLAYLIYTSGTTGKPKGVEVEHRSLASTLGSVLDRFGFGPDDRMPHLSRFTFDISLVELFAVLLAGGVCEILAMDEILDADALRGAVERSTRLHASPSLLRRISGPAPRLRTILTGGEAVPPALREEILTAFPRADLAVLYGPTETAILATAFPVPCERRPERSLIGGPLDSVEVRVMDPHGHPVPLGIPGELWIGGPGVARGYFRRPELTAERFVDGFYRSGDLVRQVPSEGGALEFLGRTDHQVKLRGFRVEPGEIEAALLDHAAVREAVVVATGEGEAMRLIAYVSPAGVDAAELRAHLAARLPAYMVPAAVVVLPALPVTAHGKVDRARLPSPLPVQEAGEAPRTPAEEVVAGIWCEVLSLPKVSRTADFFELGGHSLLATQVISRLRAATGTELAVRELFLAPTVAGLAAALADSIGGVAAPPIIPVPRGRDLPLSFAQERLWFLDRLAPGLAAYHIPLAVALRGNLRQEALEAALSVVVGRHEALRTRFGEQTQIVDPPAPWSLPRVDLSGLPGAARPAEARRLAAEDAARPFDLTAGPPAQILRTTLLRLAPAEHALLLCVHHIAADAWSMGVMIDEISTAYQGLALPALPVQYADFAVWQRDWLRGEVLERQLGYWRDRLDGAPRLELPIDHQRPAVQRFRGAAETLALPPGRAEALARLARRHDATLFMAVLAALQALLARHTGQDDVVVGTPIAGRNRVEVEPLIGFFVNTLVLRGDLSGDPTVSDLISAARRTSLEAFSHQDLPFERLVEEMRPDRRLAVNPLFQVILAVQNAPRREVALPGVSLELLDVEHPVARFDLEVLVWEQDAGLTVRLVHDADLFDRGTIARLAAHFDRLLGALENPDLRLSNLPLLSEAETRELLQAGHGGPVETMDLLERIASHPAEALAVGTLTYGELRIRAGAVADELRARGVGPDVPVGLHAERSPELVVGALAVLLAGGAYLPLDPSQPAERLDAMVRESGVEVVLSRKDLKDCNDRRDKRSLVPAVPFVLGAPVSPDDLAYILHTSGSTGQPKGVQIPRRGLAALVGWHVREYGVTGRDRAMMVASPSFDASVWEIWPYLAAGASLHLPDEETRLSPDRLLAWMAAEGITLAFLPTPLAEPFLKRAAEGVPEGLALRALLTGGDRLRRRPDPRLPFAVVNHYGPTESSVVATRETVAALATVGEGLPGIGRPIDGTRALVLDRWLGLAPAGVPGELAIGGAGLARGYLGRPDLTAERFVPDPFAERPGERVYLTGDRVRRLPAGGLEFLGRTDHQIKLRGVRIEPGEVEAALLRHPGIREAAVAVRHDTQGPRLVAWIVSGSGSAVPGLRRFLAAELPEPMVPSAFVVLEALPLTRTGKVDRAALVSPISPISPDRSPEAADYVAPGTPLEETLARVVSGVLGGARVGMRDNFFDLGGHSLLATQLVSRLVKEHELPVSLQMVFDSATLADLADRIVQQELESADAELLDEALIDLMRDLT